MALALARGVRAISFSDISISADFLRLAYRNCHTVVEICKLYLFWEIWVVVLRTKGDSRGG